LNFLTFFQHKEGSGCVSSQLALVQLYSSKKDFKQAQVALEAIKSTEHTAPGLFSIKAWLLSKCHEDAQLESEFKTMLTSVQEREVVICAYSVLALNKTAV
jgi:hypothetical protein